MREMKEKRKWKETQKKRKEETRGNGHAPLDAELGLVVAEKVPEVDVEQAAVALLERMSRW